MASILGAQIALHRQARDRRLQVLESCGLLPGCLRQT